MNFDFEHDYREDDESIAFDEKGRIILSEERKLSIETELHSPEEEAQRELDLLYGDLSDVESECDCEACTYKCQEPKRDIFEELEEQSYDVPRLKNINYRDLVTSKRKKRKYVGRDEAEPSLKKKYGVEKIVCEINGLTTISYDADAVTELEIPEHVPTTLRRTLSESSLESSGKESACEDGQLPESSEGEDEALKNIREPALSESDSEEDDGASSESESKSNDSVSDLETRSRAKAKSKEFTTMWIEGLNAETKFAADFIAGELNGEGTMVPEGMEEETDLTKKLMEKNSESDSGAGSESGSSSGSSSNGSDSDCSCSCGSNCSDKSH